MEAENKQKSVIEFIESVNADDKNSTRVISQPTSETEEREINLELSLGGCYSENKSSSEGGSNVGPRVGITERSDPNASDIFKDAQLAARNDAFLKAVSIMNWEIYRWTLLQSIVQAAQLGCRKSYPDPEGLHCLAPISGVDDVNMITQRPPRWEAQDLVRTRCPAQTRRQNCNTHTAAAKIQTCTPGMQSPTRVPTELRHRGCMPNCYARVMSTSEEDNHIILVAKTSVSAGTELTYDYRFDNNREEPKVPCKCGSPNWRKYIN